MSDDFLDDLIAEGMPLVPKRNAFGEMPRRSPIESESRFIRYCAWFDDIACHCGQHEYHFDGIFEERAFIRTGDKHWLKCAVLPTAATEKVSYVRKHKVPYCSQCTGAIHWPRAAEHEVPPNEDYKTCLVPNR